MTCYSSESRRFLYVSEPNLGGDEHPVFWISVDDVPAVGLYGPNFGVAMAFDEEITTSARGRARTYSDLFADPRFAPQMQELARLYTRGREELEAGAADTGPPTPLPSR